MGSVPIIILKKVATASFTSIANYLKKYALLDSALIFLAEKDSTLAAIIMRAFNHLFHRVIDLYYEREVHSSH